MIDALIRFDIIDGSDASIVSAHEILRKLCFVSPSGTNKNMVGSLLAGAFRVDYTRRVTRNELEVDENTTARIKAAVEKMRDDTWIRTAFCLINSTN